MADAVTKIKWKRARTPKVRTGCLTCKIRHLKCDERKPTCLRCEKDKRACDGYVAPAVSKPKPRPKQKQKPLVLHRKENSYTAQRLVSTSQLLLPASPPLETFGSPIELDLCHHFRTCTVSELASSLNAMNFWHEYALPLSQTSKPVKAAIYALGGAHKSFKLQDQAEGTSRSLAHSYELASVQQYNNAIRIIHEYMSSPEKNFQVILTCCLIFICTESLYGRYENVSRHLEAAFSLLSTRDRWNDLGTECHGETGARGKHGDLARFMENICPSLCSLASDLFFYVGDNHSPKLVSQLTKWVEMQDPINLEDPGTPFTSAQEAASSLTRIESMCDVELYTECPTCLAEGCCGNASLVCRHINNELDAEPYYHHWNARFNAFRNSFDPSKVSDLELYRFKILELEEATWAATLKLEDSDDDLETSDCINMLQKAESIIQFLKTDKGQTFTFQANLVPPIAYVIISCQDAKIQWKGVELLRSLGRREGVWDSKKMADIYAEMITAKENRLLTWEDIPADVPQLTELLGSLQLSTPLTNLQ